MKKVIIAIAALICTSAIAAQTHTIAENGLNCTKFTGIVVYGKNIDREMYKKAKNIDPKIVRSPKCNETANKKVATIGNSI